MRSFGLPVLIIIASVGVVFMYTIPTYNSLSNLRAQEESIVQTLNDATRLEGIVNNLKVQYDSFPANVRERLQKMLPDVVGPIDVVLEVNEIAKRGVILTDVDAEVAVEAENFDAGFVTYKPYKTINASYGLAADYSRLLDFTNSLELNLRLTDIKKLELKSDDQTGFIEVTIDADTYWLNE